MKKLKKLTLCRETLRNLTPEGLALVKGGVTQFCYPSLACEGSNDGCTNNCQTGTMTCHEN